MKLRVEKYGKGAPLILVHGGPGMPGYMRRLGELLKSRYSIVEYYQRDFAGTGSGGPYTIASYVSDLGRVAVGCGPRKPVIVAHSFGCALAVELAKRRPAALNGVVLLNPMLDGGSWDLFIRRLMRRLRTLDPRIDAKLARAQSRLDEAAPEGKLRAMRRLNDFYWPAYFPSGKKPARFEFAKVDVAAAGEVEKDFLKKLRDGTFVRGLRKIQAPVVQIHGTRDPIPWRMISRRLRKDVPRFRLCLVGEAGHFPWLDAAARRDFLAALERALR